MNANLTKSNTAELNRLLVDFYNLTGIKICICDSDGKEISYYPDRFTPFCAYLRSCEQMDARCRECDRRAFSRCRRTQTVQIYSCHAGLTECVAPVFLSGGIGGFIVIGQIRGTGEKYVLPPGIPLDPARLDAYYEALPTVPWDKIESAVHILEACAAYEQLKKFVEELELSPELRLEKYVNAHLGEELGVELLCSRMRVSRRELYALVRCAFGCTPAEFVRLRRLNRAAELLLQTSLSVSRVAADCGIGDYNYFSKVFRRQFGISPRAYRKGPVDPTKSR